MDFTQFASITTGNPKIDHVLGLAGVFVTLASFVASSLNSRIRAAIDAEGEAPRPFLWLALAINYAAFNLDKAAQMHRLLRGASATVLTVKKADPAAIAGVVVAPVAIEPPAAPTAEPTKVE